MTRRASLVRELFDAARARPVAQRDAWLLARSRDENHADRELIDAALLEEVRDLLAWSEQPSGLLDVPLFDPEHLAGHQHVQDPVPEQLGPYRIVRPLGRGSMGTVYEALQENPRRSVALKVLRAGMATDSAVRRFQLEVDALGRLDHPYVASIYEAGITDLGDGSRPYLAMELVRGERLDLAGRRPGSSRVERLELLARIGEGVAHAHSRGVVHRDLKPDNVIVDADLRPRILDFGVARLLEPDARPAAHATAEGILVGTLQYMSPEQAMGDVTRIDTRSDVYALGVLGYELLTGRPPYDLAGLDLPEMLAVITDRDGPLAGTLDGTLRGDVETILAMSMHKDPARRYQSAAEFTADIRRHLADEPILAMPASTADQLRRFARKNRGLVGGAGVGLVLLLLGLAAMAWGLIEARDRNRANLVLLASEREARLSEAQVREQLEVALSEAQRSRLVMEGALVDAEGLTDFVTGMILSVQPERQGWDIRLGDVLDAAVARARAWEASDKVRARLDGTLGQAYLALGRYPEAATHLERAFAAWQQLVGPDAPATLDVQANLGQALRKLFDTGAAWALQLDLLGRRERLQGADDERTLAAELELGITAHWMARFDEGAQRLSTLIERAGGLLGVEHGLVVDARLALGRLYVTASRFDLARDLFEQVLGARLETVGEDHLDALFVRRELAKLDLLAGRFDQALRDLAALREGFSRALGPDHPETLLCLADEARVLDSLGRFDEALAAFGASIAGLTRVAGADDGKTQLTRKRRASLLVKLGRTDEAMAAFQALIAEHDSAHPAPDWWLGALRERGVLFMMHADFAGARSDLEVALAGLRAQYGDRHIAVAHVIMDISNVDLNERQMVAAESRLVEAEALYRELLGDDATDTLAARMNRARVYAELGRWREAEPILLEAIERFRATLGSEHISTLRPLVWLAEIWIKTDRAKQAGPLLEATVASLQPRVGANHELVVEARHGLVDVFLATGRLDDARRVLDELAEPLRREQAGWLQTHEVVLRHARWLRASSRPDEAEAVLLAAIAAGEDKARGGGEAEGDSEGTGYGATYQPLLWELRFELAGLVALDGRVQEAVTSLESLRATATATWGDQTPDAARAAAALAELRAENGGGDRPRTAGPGGRR